jgi:hypothetical protein
MVNARHRRRTTARSCRGPASVRRPSRLHFRQRDGVTAVAVRGAVLCTLLAATAAPLWLRHAGPGRAAQARPLAGRNRVSAERDRIRTGAVCHFRVFGVAACLARRRDIGCIFANETESNVARSPNLLSHVTGDPRGLHLFSLLQNAGRLVGSGDTPESRNLSIRRSHISH